MLQLFNKFVWSHLFFFSPCSDPPLPLLHKETNYIGAGQAQRSWATRQMHEGTYYSWDARIEHFTDQRRRAATGRRMERNLSVFYSEASSVGPRENKGGARDPHDSIWFCWFWTRTCQCKQVRVPSFSAPHLLLYRGEICTSDDDHKYPPPHLSLEEIKRGDRNNQLTDPYRVCIHEFILP